MRFTGSDGSSYPPQQLVRRLTLNKVTSIKDIESILSEHVGILS